MISIDGYTILILKQLFKDDTASIAFSFSEIRYWRCLGRGFAQNSLGKAELFFLFLFFCSL